VFTSGIISTREGQRMALFFTGRRHAGENLSAVLTRRAADLAPPVQMCDALSRNLPKTLEVILGNCLAHYLDSDIIQSGAPGGTRSSGRNEGQVNTHSR
jgi:hypothetical protein